VPTQDWVDGYRAGWFDARNDEMPRGKVAPIADAPSKKAKKPRKASAYNLEYKKQYAKLKKKHPRTSFAGLAKKAHRATKKVMK